MQTGHREPQESPSQRQQKRLEKKAKLLRNEEMGVATLPGLTSDGKYESFRLIHFVESIQKNAPKESVLFLPHL